MEQAVTITPIQPFSIGGRCEAKAYLRFRCSFVCGVLCADVEFRCSGNDGSAGKRNRGRLVTAHDRIQPRCAGSTSGRAVPGATGTASGDGALAGSGGGRVAGGRRIGRGIGGTSGVFWKKSWAGA